MPRRLAAAERALRLGQEKLPLFRDQVAAEQPTPEERIVHIDAQQRSHLQSQRDLAARHWRWGGRMLAAYPEVAPEILAKWQASTIPPTGSYFADFLRTELKKRGLLKGS